MAYTLEQLKKMTVGELRHLAEGLKEEHAEALRGYTQMHKEQLLLVLCKILGIDTREHRAAALANKMAIKAQIRELKRKRDAAIAAHDRLQLKLIRRQIHALKRKLRKAAV
ncbi:MAG TPA: hypothetical protein VNM72_15485 [Blastocatellia bacterium]|nr:hypothetical protein [Blastocatellia bacterium]